MQYGSQYDAALHVLLWEMLTKLEKMLPVPDLKQVFSVLPLPMRHSTTTYCMFITKQAVITDCNLARRRPFCGGMRSNLSRGTELDLQAVQKFRTNQGAM